MIERFSVYLSFNIYLFSFSYTINQSNNYTQIWLYTHVRINAEKAASILWKRLPWKKKSCHGTLQTLTVTLISQIEHDTDNVCKFISNTNNVILTRNIKYVYKSTLFH